MYKTCSLVKHQLRVRTAGVHYVRNVPGQKLHARLSFKNRQYSL